MTADDQRLSITNATDRMGTMTHPDVTITTISRVTGAHHEIVVPLPPTRSLDDVFALVRSWQHQVTGWTVSTP